MCNIEALDFCRYIMKITVFIMMLLTSFSTSAKTFFCAYEGTDEGQEGRLQAKVVVNEDEVELIRDRGDSYIYTTLFNKKQLVIAARPVYDRKRGRLINPGVDTLSLIIPTTGQARKGVLTQIMLARVIQDLPDTKSLGTCM